ncbi:MAG: glycosyltransferase family 4 protein [Gemmatimonadota bacterium]
MRILALAPQPFFTPRGTPYSVYYRTLTMAEQGADVDLLTYGEGANVRIPGVRHIRIAHPPFLAPVGIGPSASKLLLDAVMLGTFVRRVSTEAYDVVHAHEESVFFAALLKPLFGYRLVYDMHSSLPQQLSNFGFSSSRLLVRLFEALERFSLRQADVVITVCPELAAHAEARMPDASRQLMIENTRFEPVRLAETSPDDAAPSVEFPANRKVVFYAGSFEPYQGLDLVVRAFADVLPAHPDAMLVLAGGFPDQVAALERLAVELGVSDACLLPGRIPQEAVRRLLPQATVLVSSRVVGTNTPLKIYQQLASGVPLVATRIRSHTQVLDDELAILVEPTAEDIAVGLGEALGGSDAVKRRAEAAQERARRDYSVDVFRRKTSDLLNRVS